MQSLQVHLRQSAVACGISVLLIAPTFIAQAQATTLPIIPPTPPTVFRTTSQFVVGGVVKDAATQELVAGLEVRIPQFDFATMTDAQGAFRIPARLQPPFELIFTDDAYKPVKMEIREAKSDIQVTVEAKGTTAAVSSAKRVTSAPEQQIQYALLQKMPFYFTWAADSRVMSDEEIDMPFTVGIYGKNPFGAAISEFTKIKMFGKSIIVNTVTRPEDLTSQDMIYFPKGSFDAQQAIWISTALNGRNILTVCEGKEQALRLKAIVGIYETGGKMHIGLNSDAAEAAGLQPAAELRKAADVLESATKED